MRILQSIRQLRPAHGNMGVKFTSTKFPPNHSIPNIYLAPTLIPFSLGNGMEPLYTFLDFASE